MELAQQDRERLEYLETIPSGLAIEVYIPAWSDDSVASLGIWSERVIEHSEKLGFWLRGLVKDEVYRRGSATPVEFAVPHLPVGWSSKELAAALGVCFGLIESNDNRELEDFLHKVTLAVVVQVQDRLKKSPTI